MIYPRGDHTPTRCPFCNGTGNHPSFPDEGCDECNGTGIAGNPGCGFIAMALFAAVFWTAAALLLR